ncbi:MAG: PilZ domain-containing protein [Planctomycetota bacterium]|jgi:hypothetical protein
MRDDEGIVEHFNPRANLMGSDEDAEGRRRASGRLDQDTLACQLGPVSNISAGGMRLISRRVPLGEFDIQLIATGETMHLKGRVAWSRRVFLFKHEMGIEFIDVEPRLAKKLTRLAMNCRVRRAC